MEHLSPKIPKNRASETGLLISFCMALVHSVSAVELPASVDNSLRAQFPPIADQGKVSSCTTFATTYYAFSYMQALAKAQPIHRAEEAFSPRWSFNMINKGDPNSGPEAKEAYLLHRQMGAVLWRDFPFQSNPVDEDFLPFFRTWEVDPHVQSLNPVHRTASHFLFNGFDWLETAYMDLRDVNTRQGMDHVKALLTSGYLLTFRTHINGWQYKTIGNNPSSPLDDAEVGKNAVYWCQGWDNLKLHAMTVVGYNDDIWIDLNENGQLEPAELGAFRIANSWGRGFQDDGFTWMAYDARLPISQAVVLKQGKWPIFGGDYKLQYVTAYPNYKPQITFEVTLGHPKREQLSIWLGMANRSDLNEPDFIALNPNSHKVRVFHQMGGPYGMQGDASEGSATLVFDGWPVLKLLDSLGSAKRFFLGIEDSPEAGQASVQRIVFRHEPSGTERVSSEWTVIDSDTQWFPFDFQISPSNAPPQIQITSNTNQSLRIGQDYLLTAIINDPDGPVRSVEVSDTTGMVRNMETVIDGSHAWWLTLRQLDASSRTLTIHATDHTGNQASKTIELPLLAEVRNTIKLHYYSQLNDQQQLRYFLEWKAQPGLTYFLEKSNSLSPVDWNRIDRMKTMIDSDTRTFEIPHTSEAQTVFYRITTH